MLRQSISVRFPESRILVTYHEEIERRLPPELREKFGPFGLEDDVQKVFEESQDEGRRREAPD